MGRVYARGGRLYLDYLDEDGERQRPASGLVVGEEADAQKRLAEIEALVAAALANRARAGAGGGPLTVRRYLTAWLDDRKARGILAEKDERSRADVWIIPRLGDMRLAELRPRNVRDFVRELRLASSARSKPLAPKSVLNIYALLSQALDEAVSDEIISANPCQLKRGELPKKMDADPTWRRGAVFTREEAEALISDGRIAEDRRVHYAILFLTGMRPGEVAALRWRDYEAGVEPLGRLYVGQAYSTKHKRVKTTKTDNPRQVPVLPTLAAIIAEWKLGGLPRLQGRPAEPDDLIMPSRRGQHRNVNLSKKRFDEDLDRLALRPRRLYDARRTMISLARGGGAEKDMLRWVTHGPSGDIMDAYTTPPWSALCKAVSCLRIERRREAKILELPRAVAAGEGPTGPDPEAQSWHNRSPETKKPEDSASSGSSLGRGGRDLNPRPPA